MRYGNYVSIGWSELNDLSELLHDQRSKDLLKGLMKERFYPNDPATAGKKATEVFKFATTMAKDDIVVASDGSTVLGIGRVTGDYTYNPELPFAHCRAAEWLSKAEWKTKEREGLRTTVSEIKKSENLVEIERRILGSPPRDPQSPIELSKDSYKEVILAYSKAVKKVVEGGLKFEYLDLESSERQIGDLKQLFTKFLDDPTDANLRAFWNKDYLENVGGGGNVGVLRSKNDVAKIHGVLAEIDRSDTYNEEWERELGSHWPFWELWGRIKDAPLVSFGWTGLDFFGCQNPVPSYPGFLENYERFLRLYQDVVGTDHVTSYRSEIEINQLFAFIFAVKNKDIDDDVRALGDPDVQHIFELVKAQPKGPVTPEPLEHLGPKNLIFYGPPGTGKTYQAINRTLELINADPDYCKHLERSVLVDKFNQLRDEGRVEFITFHQAYSYEEFVEGIRPVLDQAEKNIQYELSNGVFKSIASRAESDPDNRYVLLIDEINRGNISKIFGELITLIEEDKRIGEQNQLRATLPYSKKKDFGVPPNLYIIGTMNTADRSIALLDVALRRRFKFMEFMPEYEDTGLNDCKVDGLNLGRLLSALNKKIEILLDRDHQIGHSFFIKVKDAEDQKKTLCGVWYRELIPLFQEYFYNDYERLEHLLGRYKTSNEGPVGFVEKMSAEKKRSVLGVAFEAGFSDTYVGAIHRYNDANELIVALRAYVE